MFSQALKALNANRLKTSLIYLSLLFAIIAIFMITAISNGIIGMYASMLKSDGDIIITEAKISDTFFSNVDISLKDKIETFDGVKNVYALIVGASPVEELPIVAVYGVSENRFSNYLLTSGKYPKKGEAIIGKTIFAMLENPKTITIADTQFTISGVYESKIGFENGGVVLSLEDAGAIFNKSASMLLIETVVQVQSEPLLAQIKALSPKIDAKSTDAFVQNYNQFKIIRKSSFIISFIAFAMGLLGIVSIMSITIHQRKSEFGIQKAIGISTKRIVFTIMVESLIVGVLAYVSAYLISEGLLILIKNAKELQGYVNGEISVGLAGFVFVTSMVMTVIGAVIPAIKAGSTDPLILIQGNNP